MRFKTYQIIITSVLLLPLGLHANNIQVSNATVNGRNTSTKTVNVQFNLSWENSWRHNSSSGGLSYIGVKTGGTGYTGAPKVYIGSQGSVAWQASTAVSIGDLLKVSATPDRYYVVTTSHTTLSTAPTHTSGTTSNLLFVSVTDGGGSGATATASVSGGIITSYSITAAGSGYTAVPSVTIAPTNGGSGASADAYIQSWWDAAWVFVKFRVGESDPTFTGVSSSGTTITVSSTANLRVGMPVMVTSGTGVFVQDNSPAYGAKSTTISRIISTTTFEVNIAPTTALSNATIVCSRIWEHAALDTTDGSHTAPSGSVINAPNDSTGVFIYRSTAGSGTNTWNNVGLRWKYGSNGVADNSYIEVKVFAIEMVYVPEGSFYVGSGGTETGSFTDGSWTSGNRIPFLISSESALDMAQVGGKLWADRYLVAGTIPSAFPKGYASFYCMKYEMNQGEFSAFINTWTLFQQINRQLSPTALAGTAVLSNSNANRNGIDLQIPGSLTTRNPALYACNLNGNSLFNEADDGGWIACNRLNWLYGCAYLDWAGLRPMTELEFEKACRGIQSASPLEYAWGFSTVHTSSYAPLSNPGTANELPNSPGSTVGNASNSTTDGVIDGPLRCGIFATAGTSRVASGSTYYGIMNMSGNLAELVVTVGNVAGLSYTGKHGDGNMFIDGHADVDFWPGINGNSGPTIANTVFLGTVGVRQSAGAGFRGSTFANNAVLGRVSDRSSITNSISAQSNLYGIRGVRSAP